jgi:hypothetical protein
MVLKPKWYERVNQSVSESYSNWSILVPIFLGILASLPAFMPLLVLKVISIIISSTMFAYTWIMILVAYFMSSLESRRKRIFKKETWGIFLALTILPWATVFYPFRKKSGAKKSKE